MPSPDVGDRVQLVVALNTKTQREPDREARLVAAGEQGVVERNAGALLYVKLDDGAILVTAPSLVRVL